MLDDALLRAYEEVLKEHGVPVDGWQPGFPRDQQPSATTDGALPPEATAWFEWHDGGPGYGLSKLCCPTGERMLPFARALEVSREYREIALRLLEPDFPELANADDRWDPRWLPILGPQLPIVLVPVADDPGQSEVRRIDLQQVPSTRRDEPGPSLEQLVLWWLAAVEAGAWTWDTGASQWREDGQLLEAAFVSSGLA